MVEYQFCDRTGDFFEEEDQLTSNFLAMKNAYREKVGLLTTKQIVEIRGKYGITQRDLSLLLGWGTKTVTRYERCQVQDPAHDTILRKLDSDPEWSLQLLMAGKDKLSEAAYQKYLKNGTTLFEKDHDLYLEKAIMSQYAIIRNDPDATGNKVLSLGIVVDMIRYFANSVAVKCLYRVKLMKLLWYSDALSYKRRGYSMSGLVYRALPMGAVPVAYELILDLSRINCKEVEIGFATGYQYLPTESKEYACLTSEDKEILDTVIQCFGASSKRAIVETMHQEDAYTKTALNDVIKYSLVSTLSIS